MKTFSISKWLLITIIISVLTFFVGIIFDLPINTLETIFWIVVGLTVLWGIVEIYNTKVKKLWKLVLEHREYFHGGLCWWIFQLRKYHIITTWELYLLKLYMFINAPNWTLRLNMGDRYWFFYHNINPRIDWINKQIKKL